MCNAASSAPGNMGVAQGMDVLLDLAERLHHRRDIGFLFVGRGSDARRLRGEAKTRGLDNVVFHDEIDPAEIIANAMWASLRLIRATKTTTFPATVG